MKSLIKLSTLLILLLAIGSCNKDDDKNPIPENSIIGKWTLVSYKITNFENTGQTIDDAEGSFPRPTVEFKSNNLCHIVWEEDEFMTIEYTIADNMIFFEEPIAFDHNSFTYDLSKNTLILTRTDSYNGSSGNYTEKTKITLTK